MTDIRGIHYETSKPVFNERDGYWYQRRRQVDEHGNLVGIGDQRIRLQNPGSKDGQYRPDLDWSKLGTLGGDVGQIGAGVFKRDPRMIAKGSTSFAQDVQNGVFKDYDSWPGTDKPWEQGDIPAPSASPNDRSSLNVPSGSANASAVANPRRNSNAPASPPEPEGMIGLFSGKPMRFPFAPIFDTRAPSGVAGNPSRRSALDDLIWNGLGSRAFSVDAADPPPLAPDRRISSVNESGSASLPDNYGTAFAAPNSVPPVSQGPLSLNDAYLEYLKRLQASQ